SSQRSTADHCVRNCRTSASVKSSPHSLQSSCSTLARVRRTPPAAPHSGQRRPGNPLTLLPLLGTLLMSAISTGGGWLLARPHPPPTRFARYAAGALPLSGSLTA